MSVSESRQSMSGSLADLLAGAPVEARANLSPSSIEVASNLAEDTVIAGVMDVARGVNKVALFANPFVGGAEEMLYVDEKATLRWARHLNVGSQVAQAGGDTSGWSIAPVMNDVVEVAVAVHPTGAVFAWVLHGDATSRHLASFELVADPAVPDGFRWEQGSVWLPDMNLSGLSVQYCDDRPATPVVFVTDPREPRLFWFLPNFSADVQGLLWHAGGDFAYDPADAGLPVVAGIDDPSESEQPSSVVRVVRVWSAAEDGLYMTTYLPRLPNQPYTRRVVLRGEGVEVAGRWVHPYGAGVVARTTTGRLVMAVAPSPGGWNAQTFVLDQALGDLTVWQDAENLLHLYGRDAKATLNAVHQTGWAQDPGTSMRLGVPVWDAHADQRGQSVLTTRPLVAKVATYEIDAFPDELPSQHVMHQGVEPGESCAIYTQSTRTNFWSTEKVRLVPETLPQAYAVPRYQTTLTVKDGFGAPMGGVPVSLTADVPVDLEVGGGFYRTGSVTPVTLVSDATGRITMRVVAKGLSVPMLYATAPGLSQSVTVQMAADVHKFLAGDGSLPNHQGGFTAETVTTATKPDGTPLFPKVREDGVAGDWPPSAEDVVTWCQAAFAVDAGTPLPPAMRAGLGEGEQVHGFTLQTHDPDRAGFEVFTNAEQLTARRAAIEAKGGIFDEAEDWWGDVWQGIREGVNAVGEVFINVADSVIELVITLADGVIAVLRAAWDDILTAAHAVEAAFVAIGAAIDDALTWLKWAFDFGDVVKYAKQLDANVRQLPSLVRPLLDDFEPKLHGFFVAQEAAVHELFTDLKQQVLPNRTTGSLQTPMAGVPAHVEVPATAQAADQVQGPHASWLSDKLTNGSTSAAGSSGVVILDEDLKARVDGLADEFMHILTSSAAGSDLEAALEDVGKLFTNLFRADDAQTAMALELATLFDLLEHLIEAGLEFLDSASHQAIEWLRRALDTFIQLLDTPVTGLPLLDVIWDYLVEAAGLHVADFPLTWGHLMAVFVAFPTTVICKMITGHAPVTDHATAGNAGPINEIFLGISELIEIPLRLIITQGGQAPWVKPSYIAFLLLRAYRSFAEFPLLYGFVSPPATRASVAAYVSWVLDLLWNVADFAVFMSKGSTLEKYYPWSPPAPPPQAPIRAAYAASSAYGLAQGVLAAITWWPDNINYYTAPRLAGRVARRLPQTTGFIVKVWLDAPMVPANATAFLAKNVSDVVNHAFTGISQIAFAAVELANPTSIKGDGALKYAVLDTPYDSGPIQVDGGLPSYHWKKLDELPPGLDLVADTSTFALGATAMLRGTPFEAGDYQFRLQVTDSYAMDPSTTEKSFALTVYDKPTASFTASKHQGVAPLDVQFFDTSAGGATTWAWDLGDGRKSADQNPVVVYDKPGTYQVTLTVTNPAGTSTSPPLQILVEPPTK